jgi:hypothetical protein
MTGTGRLISSWRIFGLLAIVSVVFTGVAVGQVMVDGDFKGTMVGYGDDANREAGDAPNQIVVQGSFTIEGEPAENVEIEVTSGEYTVLDTSSLELRVPGEGIEFSTSVGPDQITESTGQLPEGTEVELTFSVYYIGDADGSIANNTINAANINVNYQTLGGSEDGTSFNAVTNVENRPEAVIDQKERGSKIGTAQEVLSYIGGLAVVIIVLYLLVYLVNQMRGGGKRDKPT